MWSQSYEGEWKLRIYAKFLLVIAVAAVASGCAFKRETQFGDQDIGLEFKDSEISRVTFADIRKEHGMAVVRGEIEFARWAEIDRSEISGRQHIDVTLRLADGRQITQKGITLVPVQLPYTGDRNRASRKLTATFVAQFQTMPTRGSKLEIMIRDGPPKN